MKKNANKANIRKARLKKISQSKKDQSGFFAHFNTDIEQGTRQRRLRKIDEAPKEDSLYDLSFDQQDSDSDSASNLSSGPLSTRYIPGTSRMSRRIGNGVVQDPLTNETIDYSEPYKHNGEEYPGGSVSLQSSIMYLTATLNSVGQKKYSKKIFEMLHKLSKLDD